MEGEHKRYVPPHKRFGNSLRAIGSSDDDSGPSSSSRDKSRFRFDAPREKGSGVQGGENWRKPSSHIPSPSSVETIRAYIPKKRQSVGQLDENWRTAADHIPSPSNVEAARNHCPKHITNKMLADFLTMDPNTVVMSLVQLLRSNSKVFEEQRWDSKSKQLTQFVKILKIKVLESLGVDSFKNQILMNLCNSTVFWDNIKKHLLDLLVEQQEDLEDGSSFQSTFQFLENSYELYAYINDTMRTLATTFMSTHLKNFHTVTLILKQNAKSKSELEILETKFKELQQQVNEYNAKIQELVNKAKDQSKSTKISNKQIRDIESVWKGVPPDDFRQIPIIPTMEELQSEEIPFLRPNLKEGSYPSAEVYLDVQFRLLREDYMVPLRNGVKEYFEHKYRNAKLTSRNTVKLYKNVTILPGLEINTRIPSYTIQLDKYDRFLRRIKWDKSKRLLNGSLLLFTNDNLRTGYFATVAKRDVQNLTNDSKFCISWESEKPKTHFQSSGDDPINSKVYFDMLECDIFFESYRHTLAGLQNLNLDNFPLRPYLINGLSDKLSPKYIENQTVSFDMLKPSVNEDESDLRELTDLTDDLTWPSAEELGMDNSQFNAFKAAITREISVIQGPPGTGKTYIGIQIAKLILGNQQLFLNKEIIHAQDANENEHLYEALNDDSLEEEEAKTRPILIVCYTNHALDQFLEAILQEIHKVDQYSDGSIIRIGGNSKSENIKDLLLHKQFDIARSNRSFPGELSTEFNHSYHALKDLKNLRMFLMQCLKNMKKPIGIINFKLLLQESGMFSRQMYANLTTDDSALLQMLDSMKLDKEIEAFGFENIYSNAGAEFRVDETPLIRKLSSNNTKKTVQPHKYVEPLTLPIENEENTDTEDYDLDELMADRLLEIEHEVQDSANGFSNSKFTCYRIRDSVFAEPYEQLCSIITECDRILKNPKSTEDAKMDADYELFQRDGNLYEERDAEGEKYPKQITLLQRICNLYKEGRLNLLPMNDENIKLLAQKLKGNSFNIQTSHLLWSFYFSLLEKLRPVILPKVYELEKQILEMSVRYEEARNACEGHLLCNAKFVGMTTTGAAKYNTLLKLMGSRMVIVEEAAEVLESHIVTSITENCEHLVLIGDHKQLRPKYSAYELTKHFNFDVSLFERLINNNLQCYTLEIQHRMRPEISDLLVPTIYPSLKNHESVHKYPNVAGVALNSFFINHDEFEKEDADVSSHVNEHEARFIVALCKHLLLNGYTKDQITVLTTYIGQVFLMKKIIREDEPYCQGVRVTAVDNFQGEENDIILLSLVRSNDANKVGFVKIDNRICVSLSRAKHGMFVVGNMNCVSAASSKWHEIVKKLESRPIPSIGTHLSLKCTLHGNIIQVSKKEDFALSPCGGCTEICNVKLPNCVHFCPQICHGTDINHTIYECRRKCERKCSKNGHPCVTDCYEDPCPKCRIEMETTLKCSHTHYIECHINPDIEFKCPTLVLRLLACGHSLQMKCFENPRDKECPEMVIKVVPKCSHVHEVSCSTKIEQYQCEVVVDKKIPSCGHELSMPCYKSFEPSETWTCNRDCDTRVANCGHSCNRKCHANSDPNHENYNCPKDCARRCRNGHRCGEDLEHNHKCYSKCPPCEILIKSTLKCAHTVELKCHETLNPEFVPKYLCKEMVHKLSPCGHEILIECWDTAVQSKCETLVECEPKVRSACGHGVDIPCKIKATATPEDCSRYCKHPCRIKLEMDGIGCEHTCTGTCSSCHQGRLHVKCAEKCTRVLVCGHVCKAPCSSACPPCEADCDMKCEHSKCKLKCGIPCIPCNEPCGRKCIHQACTKLCSEKCDVGVCNVSCDRILKCGHPCISLCSEKCPKLCRICDKDVVTEIFFEDEDDDDARFIELEDCGHLFELGGLNKWMESTPENNNQILTKKCPKCTVPIKNSLRYKALLTATIDDVLKVKSKIFGNKELILREQINISKKVKELWNNCKTKNWTELPVYIGHLSQFIYVPHLNPILNDPQKMKVPLIKKFYGIDPEERNMKKINQVQLQTISKITSWLRNAQQVVTYSHQKFSAAQAQIISSKYEELFGYLLLSCDVNNGVLTNFQTEQIQLEFNRLEDFFEITRRYDFMSSNETSLSTRPTLVRYILQIEVEILNINLIYGKKKRSSVLKDMKYLDLLLKKKFDPVYVPNLSIFEAMVETREAWYKCPNGHFYAIGNCGMPSQVSRCPECKCAIGSSGTEHVNAMNNTRVTHAVGEIPLI